MAGYGIGGAIDDFFWQPSSKVAPLLNKHPGQKLVIGALQAGGQALSNSTLLEEVIIPVLDKLKPGVSQ